MNCLTSDGFALSPGCAVLDSSPAGPWPRTDSDSALSRDRGVGLMKASASRIVLGTPGGFALAGGKGDDVQGRPARAT